MNPLDRLAAMTSILEDVGGPFSMRRDLQVMRICMVLLATAAMLAIGVAAADILAPTAVAVVLALVLAPASAALERLRLPAGLAALVVVVATVSVLVFAGLKFAPSVADVVKRGPTIMHSVEMKLSPIRKQLAAVEKAFRKLALDEATNVPRQRCQTDAVMLHVLPAAGNTLNAIGLKAYTTGRFDAKFHVYLFDPKHGGLTAVLEADHLGAVRTGAASGVSTGPS